MSEAQAGSRPNEELSSTTMAAASLTPLFSDIVFEVDDDGYPTEESLNTVVETDIVGRMAHFLVYCFPEFARQIPCSVIEVRDIDHPISGVSKEVFFATRGWSGCESLIEAVLANRLLRAMYYAKWERGGAFTFVIPVCDLERELKRDQAAALTR